MKIFNRKSLKPRRQDLRNNPTQAEAFLWGFLKHSQLEDKKFRRQASIGSYIVDFYCPSEKLVIELTVKFILMKKQKSTMQKEQNI